MWSEKFECQRCALRFTLSGTGFEGTSWCDDHQNRKLCQHIVDVLFPANCPEIQSLRDRLLRGRAQQLLGD